MSGWHRWEWPVHLLQGLERSELFCRSVLQIIIFFTIFQINIQWLKCCLQCSSFNPEVSPVKWRNLIFSEIVNDECGGICDPNAK